MPAAGWLRPQLEAGVRYPTTPAGAINTYRNSRALALDLNRAEGRPLTGRPLKSMQDQIARYLRGERTPSPERTGALRRLARRRIAGRSLEPYRNRGAFIHVKGRVLITISEGRRIQRNVEFGRRVSPATIAAALDAAEDAMVAGRRSDWKRAEHATLVAAFKTYEETPFEEALSLDYVSIQP